MAGATWYFIDAKGKLGEVWNLIHWPYTLMVQAYLIMGATLAPEFHLDRLLPAMFAYFLGLGIAAHAFDQLSKTGSHYVKFLTNRELLAMGLASLAMAAGIGIYHAVTIAPFLLVFIAIGAFFVLAYTLPDKIGTNFFHRDISFAFSFGLMPFLTSYYVNTLTITPQALAFGLPIALTAWIEIVLSRYVRSARKLGWEIGRYKSPELALTLLVSLVYSLAFASVMWRLF